MTMGFNHEVRHDGRLFHVQTEDSGRDKGHIFTHVFHSGTVVASDRVLYEDGSTDGKVAQLLKDSHASMLRRLVSGALDGSIERTLGSAPVEEQVKLVHDELGTLLARRPAYTEASVPAAEPTTDRSESPEGNHLLDVLRAEVSGTIGIAIIDHDGRCQCVGHRDFDIERAAAGALLLVRTKAAVMKQLGVEGALEDMLITLTAQFHLIRPVDDRRVLFVVIDRSAGNLAMARHKLAALAEQLRG